MEVRHFVRSIFVLISPILLSSQSPVRTFVVLFLVYFMTNAAVGLERYSIAAVATCDRAAPAVPAPVLGVTISAP
jgi:hypothetical protein